MQGMPGGGSRSIIVRIDTDFRLRRKKGGARLVCGANISRFEEKNNIGTEKMMQLGFPFVWPQPIAKQALRADNPRKMFPSLPSSSTKVNRCTTLPSDLRWAEVQTTRVYRVEPIASKSGLGRLAASFQKTRIQPASRI